ncbi:energy-coupling factor transporter ATPase [Vallitalea okinawensis]|uniref:energy-coupling factor transporter ATPase n=1 Tax=Vallitalea okinawensis TaxID=2078660 RepID=UPI000CFB84ED|nr:energy-coupling factor transporter ATPase [Vallitalea okinawensis]
MPIETKSLTYIYGEGTPYEKTAIKDVNIAINNGEFIGLIGHTGSGKSTLIQHFNALLKPTSGKVIVNGKDLGDDKTSKKEVRQKVGLVFQYPEHQLFEMTVYKDVAFGPENLGLNKEEVDQRVIRSLKLVGLTEKHYEKSPFELSGGQKRRVAIAGVLAMEPDILILDEPTAGLDPKGRDEILDQVKALHDETGITVILVSHSMEDVAKYVERLIVMGDGHVQFDGSPKEVFKNSKELVEMGLGVPQVTDLMNALQEKGFHIPDTIITVEEAVNYLKDTLDRKVGV